MTTHAADVPDAARSAEPAGSMLIDRLLPDYDATRIEHLVIDADRSAAWSALKELDFLQVRTPLLVAAFWVRGLPARASPGGAGAAALARA